MPAATVRAAVLKAEEATQAVSVAGDRLIPMFHEAHGERKATNQGERHEQGQGRCNAQAGCAAANPIAITAPDVQAGSQLFSTGGVRQDRCRLLEWHEAQAMVVIEPLQDRHGMPAEGAISVKEDGERAA
jgi:hypothetical protein